MIELLQVRTRGADGSTTVAHTTLGLDGHVVMALRPELLDEPEMVARHMTQVEERCRMLGQRLRRIDRAIVLVRRIAEGSLVLTGGASVYSMANNSMDHAAWWASTAIVAGLSRWLVPELLRVLARRWLQRTARGLLDN